MALTYAFFHEFIREKSIKKFEKRFISNLRTNIFLPYFLKRDLAMMCENVKLLSNSESSRLTIEICVLSTKKCNRLRWCEISTLT